MHTWVGNSSIQNRMILCETARSSAYSQDMRWRIVWQISVVRLPMKKVAENLCIDQSTLRRIYDKYELTGEVQKRDYSAEKAYRKLNKPAQLYIWCLNDPEYTCDKYRVNYYAGLAWRSQLVLYANLDTMRG